MKAQPEYKESLLQSQRVELTKEVSPKPGYDNRQGENGRDSRKLKHAKILAQINYFINGSKHIK